MKKLISILLVCLMLVSAFSVPAAAETAAEAGDGEPIRLEVYSQLANYSDCRAAGALCC